MSFSIEFYGIDFRWKLLLGWPDLYLQVRSVYIQQKRISFQWYLIRKTKTLTLFHWEFVSQEFFFAQVQNHCFMLISFWCDVACCVTVLTRGMRQLLVLNFLLSILTAESHQRKQMYHDKYNPYRYALSQCNGTIKFFFYSDMFWFGVVTTSLARGM